MYKHHEDTIRNVTDRFKKRDDVLALLVGGSIAHGFETEKSDVDIMIIVSDEDHKERLKTGDIGYFSFDDCTYDSGYIEMLPFWPSQFVLDSELPWLYGNAAIADI